MPLLLKYLFYVCVCFLTVFYTNNTNLLYYFLEILFKPILNINLIERNKPVKCHLFP